MDILFTEAWYSPKSKELVLFLCKKKKPKQIALWFCASSELRYMKLVNSQHVSRQPIINENKTHVIAFEF